MSTTAQGQAVENHVLGDLSTHKRPWEDVAEEAERPGHISRAQMHFDKYKIDRDDSRADHLGRVERPPKKKRITNSLHQATTDHQSMNHTRDHHGNGSSQSIIYGQPSVTNMYDPSKSGPSIHIPEGRTYPPVGWRRQAGEFDNYAKNQEPVTVGVDEKLPQPGCWAEKPRDYNLLPIGRSSRSQAGSHSGSSQSPQGLQKPPYYPGQHSQAYLPPIDERPPPSPQQQPPRCHQQPLCREESTGPPPPPSNYPPSQPPLQRLIGGQEPHRQHQDWFEDRREDSHEHPSASVAVKVGRGEQPPVTSQSSYGQHGAERAQEPARYQSQQQQDRYEYYQQPPSQRQQQRPEHRHAPYATPASPTRFRDQIHGQPTQQSQQAPPPAHQYHIQSPSTQIHARVAFTAAGCKSCVDSGKILRTFEEQAKEIYNLFGLWGGYTEIHEEYTEKGYGHDDVPGFKEFHRVTALMAEASVLAGYMIKLAPLLTKRIKHDKERDVDRVHTVNSEMSRLRKEVDEKLRELRMDSGEESAKLSPYALESKPQVAVFVGEQRLESMAPPSISQQPCPNQFQPDRHHSLAGISNQPESPDTSSSSQIEPVSTRRSAAYNATLAAEQASSTLDPKIVTFAIESSDPTLEAKLTKLKARLETEISEVDNLTEEKKRLEERIKELEGMVEEERERRRVETDVGMKDRRSFLSVLKGVVEMGRREGDVVVKQECNSVAAFVSGSDRPGDGSDGEEENEGVEDGSEAGMGGLRKEVEKLRERNRVCESALEHIARETRHMEETGKKVEESRRGIDLVLGRVLAGREAPMGDMVKLAMVEVSASEVVEAPLANGAVAAVVEAPSAVPVIAGTVTPAVESATP